MRPINLITFENRFLLYFAHAKKRGGPEGLFPQYIRAMYIWDVWPVLDVAFSDLLSFLFK